PQSLPELRLDFRRLDNTDGEIVASTQTPDRDRCVPSPSLLRALPAYWYEFRVPAIRCCKRELANYREIDSRVKKRNSYRYRNGFRRQNVNIRKSIKGYWK